jgi:hypothetical protein
VTGFLLSNHSVTAMYIMVSMISIFVRAPCVKSSPHSGSTLRSLPPGCPRYHPYDSHINCRWTQKKLHANHTGPNANKPDPDRPARAPPQNHPDQSHKSPARLGAVSIDIAARTQLVPHPRRHRARHLRAAGLQPGASSLTLLPWMGVFDLFV